MRAIAGFFAILCLIVGGLAGTGAYLLTMYFAYLTSFGALLLTLFFPLIGQLVWIVILWKETGTFLHLLTVLCLACIAFLATGVVLGSWAEKR